MQAQIRYCTSADGTRIAYTTTGSGPPLVLVPSCVNSLKGDWEYEEGRGFLEGLSDGRLLVTWDSRGVGYSQREVEDVSFEARGVDLAALVDHLGLERFDLAASVDGCPVAIVYAAEHPERVSRLLFCGLWGALDAAARDTLRSAMLGMAGAARANWDLARQLETVLAFPTGPLEAQRWLSDLLGESLSAEIFARYAESLSEVDIWPCLPKIRAPTMAVQHNGDRFSSTAMAQAAVAQIPDARLIVVEGDASHYFCGHAAWMGTARSFLDDGWP